MIFSASGDFRFIGGDESGIFRALSQSALSSAVEHHLDMVGVSGSIPLARTILMAGCRILFGKRRYARYYSPGRKSETI